MKTYKEVCEEAHEILFNHVKPGGVEIGATMDKLVALFSQLYPEKYTNRAAKQELTIHDLPDKILRTGVSEIEKEVLRKKYNTHLIDFSDGYYWSDEDHAWMKCPELWQDATPNETTS